MHREIRQILMCGTRMCPSRVVHERLEAPNMLAQRARNGITLAVQRPRGPARIGDRHGIAAVADSDFATSERIFHHSSKEAHQNPTTVFDFARNEPAPD